jgi:two-component system CheB/CheR fusion protein
VPRQAKPGTPTGPINKRQTKKKATPSSSPPFAIVGIGASAGGLESFTELFQKLPPDTGLAFVLVQHLSPQHVSMLSTFVQKATRMRVEEIQDGVRVEPNRVYIIPPNAVLEIFHGALHLKAMPEPHAAALPINAFFTSLARDQGHLAIGVILSGTGSDGARGLKDIKSDGGITFVQEPTSAKFDGMPLAAIAEAIPDYVCPVDKISRQLIQIARLPIVRQVHVVEESPATPEVEQVLQKIFILLRSATKVDFSTYKYPTISRRIKRRMVLHRVASLTHYLTYLQETPAEVRALFEDLLINVTDFFRDASAFESLKARVFPAIMDKRVAGSSIRVWVPGCSTGEEVYSIAIAFLEYLGDNASKFQIQIYGTDICESAVKIARLGVYPETASQNLSKERLERFFRKEPGGYRITKAVRDCCIFSLQDVTSQPPIIRLDLLSCRNLMIYLSPTIQKKLMDTFFYALNPNGFLMLGTAESVGTAASLFEIVDKKFRIYLKKSSTTIPRNAAHAHPYEPFSETSTASVAPLAIPLKKGDPVKEAERQVLDQFAPAWVLVDQAMDIVQFRGATAPYVEPARGQPTWNLMKMLHPGLSSDARVLIHTAQKTGRPAKKQGIRIKAGSSTLAVDLEVSPVNPPGVEPHCLILFTERGKSEGKSLPKGANPKHSGQKQLNDALFENAALREELGQTQRSLQSIIEDQNATNEEIQSANEEVMSANEELQSTNEELETAKEELQSTNEELTTLNNELSNRNSDLDHLSNDLLNLLDNAHVSIVMVGLDLRIRRFTPMAEKPLNLIAADMGRSLTSINLGFQIDRLEEKVAEVARSLSTIELETQDRSGHWYSIRIRPYKTIDHKIDGAVLVFVNIDESKNRERLTRAADVYSEGIIQTVRDPLVVLDEHFHVEKANQAFYDIFQVNPKETVGRLFYELGNRQWNIPELRDLLENVLPKKLEVRDFHMSHRFEQVGEKSLVVHARSLEWEGQKKLLILITLHDLTKRTEG